MASSAAHHLFQEHVAQEQYQQNRGVNSIQTVATNPFVLAGAAAIVSAVLLLLIRPPLVQSGKQERIGTRQVELWKVCGIAAVVFLLVLLLPLGLNAFTSASKSQLA